MRVYVFSLLVMVLSGVLHAAAYRQAAACVPGCSEVGTGACALADLGLFDLGKTLTGTTFSLAVCFLLGVSLYRWEQRRAQRGKPLRKIWQLFQYGGGG